MKNLLWKSIKQLANLNFSILILLLICFFSVIGSLIEQDQNIVYYQQNYPLNNMYNLFFNWRFMIFLGLDHIYQSWLFIGLIIIFTLSLFFCTFTVQLPSLKNARRWKFFVPSSKNNINQNLINYENDLHNSLINIIYSLVSYNFYVFHKKNFIYSYKGILGRVAPVFVHFSMIISFIGFVISSFGGYVIQEMIPVGEIFHMKNVIHSGSLSYINKEFLIKADNFFINYNLNNSIKQFFSKLYIFDHNNQIFKRKLIFVNKPLNFNGLTIYQTDWKINSLRIEVGSIKKIIFQKKLLKLHLSNKPFWLFIIPITNNQKLIFVLFNLNDPIFIYDINGSVIKKIFINQKFYINHICFCVKDIMLNTGLQIKSDPGIFFVYLGFLVLMVSTVISYISYSQIWITIISKVLSFAFSTNRSIFFFEEEVLRINQLYNQYTFINYKLLGQKQFLVK